jgi:hypothetical protein
LFYLLLILLYSVAQILQAGLMTRWKQVYWMPDDACSVKGGIGSGFSASVTVKDMQGSFFILGLGTIYIYICI